MSLEFGNGTYYSRIWFITGEKQDWLAALFRKEDGPWEIRYRFRYHAETGNDDDDRKSWYGGARDASYSEADCLARFKVVIGIVHARFGGDVHELVLQTADFDKIREALAREKWCHFTIEQVLPS
jgi:hypothetical protein